jgi:DNA-binding transcriptional regulator/RsmH inhibitor MraZ
VEVVHLFSGNALGAVGAEGEIRLPPFVLKVLARRAAEGRILFGAHESAPCLTAFDAGYLPVIGDEIERLKRRDEEREASGHAGRARRAFGLTEEADVDAGGRVALPPFLRRKGRIGARALFVGAGGTVEIWDAELALASDDPALRELARYRLQEAEKEEEKWA